MKSFGNRPPALPAADRAPVLAAARAAAASAAPPADAPRKCRLLRRSLMLASRVRDACALKSRGPRQPVRFLPISAMRQEAAERKGVGAEGIEPSTNGLRVRCSTN